MLTEGAAYVKSALGTGAITIAGQVVALLTGHEN